MKNTLLLWDIDGTLIHSGGAATVAFENAVERLHGIKVSLQSIDYRGRTDIRIAQNILKYCHLPETPKKIKALTDAYLENLQDELPRWRGKVFPGILEILKTASEQPHTTVGLLTGNLARGAELKLSHYNLWQYFEFGAFADDSINRNNLGPVALQRANETRGVTFSPHETFVIGDTPHDIECGKIFSARTIAVATGGFSYEALAEHQPTALFKDFSDVKRFFDVVNDQP